MFAGPPKNPAILYLNLSFIYALEFLGVLASIILPNSYLELIVVNLLRLNYPV